MRVRGAWNQSDRRDERPRPLDDEAGSSELAELEGLKSVKRPPNLRASSCPRSLRLAATLAGVAAFLSGLAFPFCLEVMLPV